MEDLTNYKMPEMPQKGTEQSPNPLIIPLKKIKVRWVDSYIHKFVRQVHTNTLGVIPLNTLTAAGRSLNYPEANKYENRNYMQHLIILTML